MHAWCSEGPLRFNHIADAIEHYGMHLTSTLDRTEFPYLGEFVIHTAFPEISGEVGAYGIYGMMRALGQKAPQLQVLHFCGYVNSMLRVVGDINQHLPLIKKLTLSELLYNGSSTVECTTEIKRVMWYFIRDLCQYFVMEQAETSWRTRG